MATRWPRNGRGQRRRAHREEGGGRHRAHRRSRRQGDRARREARGWRHRARRQGDRQGADQRGEEDRQLGQGKNPLADSYGWVVVAAAFTLMFVGFAAAYCFAAFFTAFQAEFGASRGDVALVFSVAAFLWFLLGAPGGMAADRFGPRCVAAAGVASLAIALWLASRAGSVGALYATYSIGIGLGVGLV